MREKEVAGGGEINALILSGYSLRNRSVHFFLKKELNRHKGFPGRYQHHLATLQSHNPGALS